MDFTQMGNIDSVDMDYGDRSYGKSKRTKEYDYLVEDCENLAETIDFISNYGVNMVTEGGELLSGYDLIVKYYAGVLAGLGLVLNDIGATIPDNLLQKEIRKRLLEIKKED